MNDFSLICVYLKSLISKLMESEENLFSEKLYNEYCSVFDQLIQIVDLPNQQIRDGDIEDVIFMIKELERAYEKLQLKIELKLKSERLRYNLKAKYSHSPESSGYEIKL